MGGACLPTWAKLAKVPPAKQVECQRREAGHGRWNAASLARLSDAVFEAPAFVAGFDDVAMMRQPV